MTAVMQKTSNLVAPDINCTIKTTITNNDHIVTIKNFHNNKGKCQSCLNEHYDYFSMILNRIEKSFVYNKEKQRVELICFLPDL